MKERLMMEKKENRIAYYRGKPIEEMSREELVAALNEIALLHESNLKEHSKERDIWFSKK